MRRSLGALPLLALWALPLVAALVVASAAGIDPAAWTALFAHPQLWPALALSLFTGLASTALALLCALIIAAGFYRSALWHRLQAASAAGMALPHLAFATGFGFLIMPSGMAGPAAGWRRRATAMGDDTGSAMACRFSLALALKEVPFLFAMIWSLLAQGDTGGEPRWPVARRPQPRSWRGLDLAARRSAADPAAPVLAAGHRLHLWRLGGRHGAGHRADTAAAAGCRRLA